MQGISKVQPQRKGVLSSRRHPAAPIRADLSTPPRAPRQPAPPQGLPPPPPEKKKLAAANGRPRRRLTSASRRAALPGDPGGVSVPSPPPARPPSRCRAPGLYIGRALAGRGVPAVRELSSAPRGGAGRAPRGAEERCLLLSPCPPAPHSRAPSSQSTLLPSLSSRPPANFRFLPRPSPVIRRGSSPAAPPRGLLRTSLPAAPTITGSRNMSTTLLSAFYDIDFLCKVREGGRRGEGGPAGSPSRVLRLCLCPRLLGRRSPRLDFAVGENPGVCCTVCSCLVGGEKELGGRAGGSRCRCLVSPAPAAATLPGASRTGFAPPRLAAHGLRITCRNRAPPGVGVGSSQREHDSSARGGVEGGG